MESIRPYLRMFWGNGDMATGEVAVPPVTAEISPRGIRPALADQPPSSSCAEPPPPPPPDPLAPRKKLPAGAEHGVPARRRGWRRPHSP
jgi:hypothetical protein